MLESIFKTKIITPQSENLDIPYYEIGIFFESIVSRFIESNKINQEIFYEFQKDYHYFNPYLDFALLHLGYKIQNPFMKEESILMGRNNYLIEIYPNSKIKTYLKATDENYKIQHIGIDSIEESFISPMGIQFIINRDQEMNHLEVAKIFLLEKMIYNKSLYENFSDYIKNYSRIENYLVRIGFLQLAKMTSNSGLVIYNQSLEDDFIRNLLNGIQEYYPNISVIPIQLEEHEIVSAQEMKEDVGEKYESRRI